MATIPRHDNDITWATVSSPQNLQPWFGRRILLGRLPCRTQPAAITAAQDILLSDVFHSITAGCWVQLSNSGAAELISSYEWLLVLTKHQTWTSNRNNQSSCPSFLESVYSTQLSLFCQPTKQPLSGHFWTKPTNQSTNQYSDYSPSLVPLLPSPLALHRCRIHAQRWKGTLWMGGWKLPLESIQKSREYHPVQTLTNRKNDWSMVIDTNQRPTAMRSL